MSGDVDLVQQVEYWRDAYRQCLRRMIANARVIGQLRDECGLSVEYVDGLVDKSVAAELARPWEVS